MRTTQATAQDVVELDTFLSPADRLEANCSRPGAAIVWDLLDWLRKTEQTPEHFKMRSLRSASGELLLVGGWNSTGLTWMMSTTAAEANPVVTVRGVLECREIALQDCPRLYNMMMRTNTGHVRLLEAIGAEFTGPIYGVGGEPFQAFYIEDKEVS